MTLASACCIWYIVTNKEQHMSDISEHDKTMQQLGEIKDGGGDYTADQIENAASLISQIEDFRLGKTKSLVISREDAANLSKLLDNEELRDLCRVFIAAGSAWDAI
jgi:hypothetical protein